MKKNKRLLLTFALILMALCTLVACGSEASYVSGQITIWVGGESQKFYEGVMDEYKEQFKEEYGRDFPYAFKVTGVDAASAAQTFLTDTNAGADIFTVPHDNLGKLLDGEAKIAPVEDDELIKQMEAQNPSSFLDVSWLAAGDGSDAAYYAVPYVSQALFLVYNKEAFAGKEDKLETWEGIMEVAVEKNTKATSFMGSDGFNFSTFLLAQPKSEDAIAKFGEKGTLKIYENGSLTNCYNWGDDQVALMRYAQRLITDPHGRNGKITTNDGYNVELKNYTGKSKTAKNSCITAVVGAWEMGKVMTALTVPVAEDSTETKAIWGATKLPSLTLTTADEYGEAKAGMEFYSGTFADCKCFVKKANSRYAAYLDDIIKFLTSDAIQARSFKDASNLPASQTVDVLKTDATEAAKSVAKAQMDSAAHSIPQPFGYDSKFNPYYYQSGGPGKYEAVVTNTGGNFAESAKIKENLIKACYIWTHGSEAPDEGSQTEKKPTIYKWLNDLGYSADAEEIKG